MKWLVIRPEDPLIQSDRLNTVWNHVCSTVFRNPSGVCSSVSRNPSGGDCSTVFPDSSGGLTVLHTIDDLDNLLKKPAVLTGCRVLFVIALGRGGINLTLSAMIRLLRLNPGCMDGSAAAMIVDGEMEMYTKSAASELALALSMAGCTLIGRCLVEGTGSLYNFTVTARNLSTDLFTAYKESAAELAMRLSDFSFPHRGAPRILCVHACNKATSNTLHLWDYVKEGIRPGSEIREISLRNKDVKDCAGCSFETCMYYSKNLSCFYGGTIVEDVYPALEWCDRLVLLCPNYNDALSASLTAMINRLTSLFRKKPFYDKQLFALIVSGYSGSDLVARQLIDALSMNKGFRLPGNFALTATANLPGSIDRITGIEKKARRFGEYLSL